MNHCQPQLVTTYPNRIQNWGQEMVQCQFHRVFHKYNTARGQACREAESRDQERDFTSAGFLAHALTTAAGTKWVSGIAYTWVDHWFTSSMTNMGPQTSLFSKDPIHLLLAFLRTRGWFHLLSRSSRGSPAGSNPEGPSRGFSAEVSGGPSCCLRPGWWGSVWYILKGLYVWYQVRASYDPHNTGETVTDLKAEPVHLSGKL